MFWFKLNIYVLEVGLVMDMGVNCFWILIGLVVFDMSFVVRLGGGEMFVEIYELEFRLGEF